MYSFITESHGKSVAKGVKKYVIKKLKLENYKKALFGTTKEEIQQKCSFNNIRQSNHIVNSIRITKTSLCGLDDKRFIQDDNIHTYALGHYKSK